MGCFPGIDSISVLQSQGDIIEAFKQAPLPEGLNLKRTTKAVCVLQATTCQVNLQTILARLSGGRDGRAAEEFGNVLLNKSDREDAVGETVRVENICKRRGNHRPKAIVGKRPRCMFTA